MMVYMDENGDAEGNYTLLSRVKLNEKGPDYSMQPVGHFELEENLPVSGILLRFWYVLGLYFSLSLYPSFNQGFFKFYTVSGYVFKY